MEAQIANVGVHVTLDSTVRQAYARQIRLMSEELRREAISGRISWGQAANQAQETRNLIMDIARGRSTPIGRAIAVKTKAVGKTLNELIGAKTQELYGNNTAFSRLPSAKKNRVYAEIVKSAGKTDLRVTTLMRRLSYAGRGLILISIALSVYTVATADNRAPTATREFAITGAGVGGGFAGGALAGIACGPGAPVCVTVGAFVGGALAAFGIGVAW